MLFCVGFLVLVCTYRSVNIHVISERIVQFLEIDNWLESPLGKKFGVGFLG